MKDAERIFQGNEGKSMDVMDVERGMEKAVGYSALLRYLISCFCTD